MASTSKFPIINNTGVNISKIDISISSINETYLRYIYRSGNARGKKMMSTVKVFDLIYSVLSNNRECS